MLQAAKKLLFLWMAALVVASCTSVPSQERGTNMSRRSGPSAATAGGVYANEPMPGGFHQILSDDGAIFADERGKTLYRWIGPKGGFCTDQRDALESSATAYERVYFETTPGCGAQWHAVRVNPGAQPVGEWSVVKRPDGVEQWAYRGDPLYTSYKDRLEGDVNGAFGAPLFQDSDALSFALVQPPVIAPPGIRIMSRRGLGLVATDDYGVLLYTKERDNASRAGPRPNNGSKPDAREAASWQPVLAGALSRDTGIWSIATNQEGLKIWRMRGKPLYRYTDDHEQADVSGYGIDGAQPATILPPQKAPEGVTVQRTIRGPVYADAQGHTLYYFHCFVPNAAGRSAPSGAVICNNWNDDPGFAEIYCPARDRCAEMWRPFAAPANAEGRGGTWSLAVIPDPVHYPLRWVPVDHPSAKVPAAIKVWTYRGLPLYAAVADRRPGQILGHDYFVVSGPVWRAVPALGPDRQK